MGEILADVNNGMSQVWEAGVHGQLWNEIKLGSVGPSLWEDTGEVPWRDSKGEHMGLALGGFQSWWEDKASRKKEKNPITIFP